MTEQERYKLLLDLTKKMLCAAEQQDTETLLFLEQRREALITTEFEPSRLASTDDIQAIRDVIQEIVDLDAKILDIVTPWRDQIGAMLSQQQTDP